jgi:hypothetical protein
VPLSCKVSLSRVGGVVRNVDTWYAAFHVEASDKPYVPPISASNLIAFNFPPPRFSMDLRKRFESFIKIFPGFESVDALLDDASYADKERADYLLSDRNVIVEQKALVVDPVDKAQQFVNRLLAHGRIRPFRKSTTRAIFDSLPDGKVLGHKMYLNMTRSIEKHIAKADRQTRDTREIFNIPEAVGVLLILNESARALPPDLIRYRLDLVYGDVSRGVPRCPHNDGVIMISDVHALIQSWGHGMPCFAFPTIHSQYPEKFRAFADAFVEAWSAFNHLPIARRTVDDLQGCVARPSAS